MSATWKSGWSIGLKTYCSQVQILYSYGGEGGQESLQQGLYSFGLLKFHDFPRPFSWLFKVFHDLNLTIFIEMLQKITLISIWLCFISQENTVYKKSYPILSYPAPCCPGFPPPPPPHPNPLHLSISWCCSQQIWIQFHYVLIPSDILFFSSHQIFVIHYNNAKKRK